MVDILDLGANDNLDLTSRIENLEHTFDRLQSFEVDLVFILHNKTQPRDAMECLSNVFGSPDVAEDLLAQHFVLHRVPFLWTGSMPHTL